MTMQLSARPNPIVRGFKKLTDFKGRDRRSQFWPYAGVAYGIFYVVQSVATQMVIIPMQWRFQANIQQLQSLETEVYNGGNMVVQVYGTLLQALLRGTDFRPLMIIMALGSLAYLVLLAAAVSRRLHDRGLSAWWAGGYFIVSHIPLGLMAVGISMLLPVIEGTQLWAPQVAGPAMMWLFGGFALSSLTSIGGLVLLIQLCLAGKTGPNRYGPQPV